MRFANSAFMHGMTERSIRHVIDEYGPADSVDLASNPDKAGLLYVGDDHLGIPLEITCVQFRLPNGAYDLLVIHALRLRPRYQREYERAMQERWG